MGRNFLTALNTYGLGFKTCGIHAQGEASALPVFRPAIMSHGRC